MLIPPSATSSRCCGRARKLLLGDHTPISSRGQRSSAQVSGQPQLPKRALANHTSSKTPGNGGSGATKRQTRPSASHRYQRSFQAEPQPAFGSTATALAAVDATADSMLL